MSAMGKSLRIGVSVKVLNNPLPSCSFINFDFLLSCTAYFDKNIILPYLVLATSAFLLSLFFLHFKN